MAKTQDNIQIAALPYRTGDDGSPVVMLVTSRGTRRWVIPKGWMIKGLTPRKAAMQEAYEEAGLVGHIVGKQPIGSFHYEKQLPENRMLCEVRVFLLRVDHQLDDWPEKAQRETRWFNPVEAASLVHERGLSDIINQAMFDCVLSV